MSAEHPIWQPSTQRVESALLTGFMKQMNERYVMNLAAYEELWRWSIDSPGEFWDGLWDFCQVKGAKGDPILEGGGGMLDATWFPGAKLNYAQNLLRRCDESDAIVFRGEDLTQRRMSHRELWSEVARFAAALRARGVKKGDVVAAYMPNMPETVVVMLAATSLGALFTSASPDFGPAGIVDRFGQVEPKVLIAADCYFYNRKRIDQLPKLTEIVPRLPSLQLVVMASYENDRAVFNDSPLMVGWNDFVAPYHSMKEIEFEQLPFDHPLFIMYSSGTTGVPKCIIHSAGGTLLQHLKEHRLHGDVKPDDRLFFFTTCGWMMWNWLVSGLASQATLLLYDGSPLLNDGAVLFDYAEEETITHFGTSAKFIDAIAKHGLKPRETHDLPKLNVIFSTGSPLSPDSFEYVYREIKEDLQLSSISGGTDILSCFVLGSPLLPVWPGEIPCRGLGMAVDVYDERGNPVRGAKGELVCTRPFPSMPIGFWNDPDDHRYQESYFSRFPDVWCQGDFCEVTKHNGLIIHGRSDATLNPGGVRIGTAEIYRQVEKLPEVTESLVIGQHWQGDVRVVLFVKLKPGIQFDEALIARIRGMIRANTTPRHVPARILPVADIPRTKSGKIVELAVRNVVHGEPVINIEALDNPEALEHFKNRPELES
ncbi:MAG: acetoacetate--CoA ligase [Candidatus Thiodiazotropha sp.]